MNKTHRKALRVIGKGSVIISIGLICDRLLWFIFQLIAARGLGPEDYGVFSLGHTILTLFFILALFGFSKGIVHFVSIKKIDGDELKRIMAFVFRFLIISSIFFGVLLFFGRAYLTILLKSPKLPEILLLFSIALPFYALFEACVRFFEGLSDMKPRAIFENILVNALLVIFSALALMLGLGLWGVSLGFLLTYIISFISVFLFFIKKVSLRNIKPAIHSEMIDYSWPLMFNSMIQILLNKMGVIFLAWFGLSAAIGHYSVSSNFSRVLVMLNAILLPIFFPVVSELISKGKIEESGKIYRQMTRLMIIFTMPLFIIFVVFPKEILLYLFGVVYSTEGRILVILSIGSFVALATGPIGTYLNAMKNTKLVLLNNIISLVVNAVLNLILIPFWGLTGAAVATTVSIFLQNILCVLELWLIRHIRPYEVEVLKPLGLGALMILAGLLSRLIFGSSVIVVILGSVAITLLFFLLNLYLRSFDKSDIVLVEFIEKKLRINLDIIKERL